MLLCVCSLFSSTTKNEKNNHNFLWGFCVLFLVRYQKKIWKKNHNSLCAYLFSCQPDFVGYPTSSWGCSNINLTILTCGMVCVCASMHIAHNGNAFERFSLFFDMRCFELYTLFGVVTATFQQDFSNSHQTSQKTTFQEAKCNVLHSLFTVPFACILITWRRTLFFHFTFSMQCNRHIMINCWFCCQQLQFPTVKTYIHIGLSVGYNVWVVAHQVLKSKCIYKRTVALWCDLETFFLSVSRERIESGVPYSNAEQYDIDFFTSCFHMETIRFCNPK